MKQIQDQPCEGHCAQNCGCYQNEPDMALPSRNLQSSKTRRLKEVCSTKQYANASCVLRSTPEREYHLRSRSLHGGVYGDQDTERVGAWGEGGQEDRGRQSTLGRAEGRAVQGGGLGG